MSVYDTDIHVHCVSENAPTLASCSFDKHGLILIFLVNSISTLLKMIRVSVHFHLLYLFSNSCDGNDGFWRHSVLVKQSSSFSRKHWTLSLHICVCQTVQLSTEFVDWCRKIVLTPVRDTSRCNQRLEAAPHWHMGKHITERHWRSSWSMQKAVTCTWPYALNIC